MLESASSSRAPRLRRLTLWAAASALAAITLARSGIVAEAAVYYGRQDALKAAFPDADEVEKRRFFLTEEQREEIQDRAKAPLKDRLQTVYVGKRGETVLGYAFFETHDVRTMPETLLVVVSPSGEVSRILLAAFYEPPEYQPAARWLEQFHGVPLSNDLRVNRHIKGIAGSTLTAHAVTSGIRRVLALFEVLIRPEDPKAE